jgi:cysteine desulfurase
MLANNEVGSIQDIQAIGTACRDRNIIFHTDATQALGKVPFDVEAMKIDLASFSAHKIYGPKGVGALYVDRSRLGDRVSALIVGGGHEWGIRSGTLNVPGIVGFGSAVQLACDGIGEESTRVRALRDKLVECIKSCVPSITINTYLDRSLPGLINISFHGIDADSLLLEMPGIALSSGSACTSAEATPSHVLTAMGRNDRSARSSVRFGIGRFNTEEEIAYVGKQLLRSVKRLRAMAPA